MSLLNGNIKLDSVFLVDELTEFQKVLCLKTGDFGLLDILSFTSETEGDIFENCRNEAFFINYFKNSNTFAFLCHYKRIMQICQLANILVRYSTAI